jgi:hypothetical protein
VARVESAQVVFGLVPRDCLFSVIRRFFADLECRPYQVLVFERRSGSSVLPAAALDLFATWPRRSRGFGGFAHVRAETFKNC